MTAVGNGPGNRLAYLDALLDGAQALSRAPYFKPVEDDNGDVVWVPASHSWQSWQNVLREVRLLAEFCEAAMEVLEP